MPLDILERAVPVLAGLKTQHFLVEGLEYLIGFAEKISFSSCSSCSVKVYSLMCDLCGATADNAAGAVAQPVF